MIEKVMKKRRLSETSPSDDLAFWLSRKPEERVSAVEILRRQHDGNPERLQRIARVIERE
jgi:hypothetical protein